MSTTVRQHDHTSVSHFKLDASVEPPIDSTLIDNYMSAVKRFAKEDFFAYRAGITTNPKKLCDEYTVKSYEQSMPYIHTITKFLLDNGLEKGDRCIIYAKNSPMWLFTDLAISFAGGISAPVYDTLGIDNIIYCINVAAARFVFVSKEYLPNIVGSLERIPMVHLIVCYDGYDSLEQLYQQATKVHAQVSQHGYLIADDTGSMYSINMQQASDASDGQRESPEQLAAGGPTVLIRYEDGMIRLNDITRTLAFGIPEPELTEDRIMASKAYLEGRISALGLVSSDINSVIFTSGTSGSPKAVLATHANVISGGACLGRQFVPYHMADAGGQNSMLSYLPLAHVFERNMEHLCIYRGYCIYYSSGNIRNLTRDMQLSRTTVMIGVPRVYCKIYQAISEKIAQAGLATRAVFRAAYAAKRLYLRLWPRAYRTGRMPLVDLVFRQIAQALGGRMEFIVSGSSALPAEVREFLEVASCARLSVGYGLTEASATGLYNYCGQHFNTANQLGYTCWQTEGRLLDREDVCGLSAERNGVGELLLRGPGIAAGYVDGEWGRVRKLTDDEGYYHTGDLVQLHPDGAVSFLRRVGLIVKLQQGEFVDLEAVEAALERSPLVQAAVVHAEAHQSAPVALLSVDRHALEVSLGRVDVVEGCLAGRPEDVKAVEEFFYAEGNRLVRDRGLKGYSVPKAYKVFLDADWAADTGLYTPSQKKKHGNFIKKFHSEIEQLWGIVASREGAGRTGQRKATKKADYSFLWVLLMMGVVFAIAVILRVQH